MLHIEINHLSWQFLFHIHNGYNAQCEAFWKRKIIIFLPCENAFHLKLKCGLIQLPHFSTLFRFQQQLLSALKNNENEQKKELPDDYNELLA